MWFPHNWHPWECYGWGSWSSVPQHIEAETKWPTFFQMTFSNTFSWMKIFEFWLKCRGILFPRVQLTICQHCFRKSHNGLVPNRWQAIIWTNVGLGCQRIYASLSLNELICQGLKQHHLDLLNHIYCLLVSFQTSCIDIHQKWSWYSTGKPWSINLEK